MGHFQTHYHLPSSSSELISVSFPDYIQSINPQNLYSESLAVNCAFITNIIDNLLGEETIHTISGRMSTGCFDFKINNILETDRCYDIDVNNSQCEIDAGFETDNYLILIEAKNYSVDDFLIRQLYYPYRLWKSRISKQVIPVLMTFSNDVFSFFIFQFEDPDQYNSIKLIDRKNFIIEPETISRDDIYKIFTTVQIVEDSPNIPFPQANKIERVIDLLGLLFDQDLTKREITENYQFNIRQAGYYADAGRYFGLIEKYQDKITKEVTFQLTDKARNILSKNHKQKCLSLIEIILSDQVFYHAFEMMIQSGTIPLKSDIILLMTEMKRSIGKGTKDRRAQSVQAWIKWVWNQGE